VNRTVAASDWTIGAEIRNIDVVKKLGTSEQSEAAPQRALPPGGDGRTRESVARTVLW